jgi:GNAT superfamily N-acetyltransferase
MACGFYDCRAMPELTVRTVDPELLVPLRHAVLRQGMPVESARFPGDLDADTFHVGGFIGVRLVGCATFMRKPLDGQDAYQLRGMATDAEFRGQGIGAQVLAEGERLVARKGVELLWCNARKIAIPFYQKCGWVVISEEFMIEIFGPHKKMRKQLPRAQGR